LRLVSLFDPLQRPRRKSLVQLIELRTFCDAPLDDHVDETEQRKGRWFVVLEVEFAGMNGVIAYDTDDIERLLHILREAFFHQLPDLVIKVFPLLAKLLY
jgi:hypothetical protein